MFARKARIPLECETGMIVPDKNICGIPNLTKSLLHQQKVTTNKDQSEKFRLILVLSFICPICFKLFEHGENSSYASQKSG